VKPDPQDQRGRLVNKVFRVAVVSFCI
jgi:hypothetical protein